MRYCYQGTWTSHLILEAWNEMKYNTTKIYHFSKFLPKTFHFWFSNNFLKNSLNNYSFNFQYSVRLFQMWKKVKELFWKYFLFEWVSYIQVLSFLNRNRFKERYFCLQYVKLYKVIFDAKTGENQTWILLKMQINLNMNYKIRN